MLQARTCEHVITSQGAHVNTPNTHTHTHAGVCRVMAYYESERKGDEGERKGEDGNEGERIGDEGERSGDQELSGSGEPHIG